MTAHVGCNAVVGVDHRGLGSDRRDRVMSDWRADCRRGKGHRTEEGERGRSVVTRDPVEHFA